MTRARAIELLSNDAFKLCMVQLRDPLFEECYEAFSMAIEALEQEPIINCKDCKHWHEWENGTGSCHRSNIMWVGTNYDDYCSFAERKEQ